MAVMVICDSSGARTACPLIGTVLAGLIGYWTTYHTVNATGTDGV
jgi:hypothetical protein